MSDPVNPIPAGYHSVTPYLLIRNATAAIEFYRQVFGAVEIMRLVDPEGRISHAEITIGNSRIMLADEHPEMDFLGPQTRGGTTVSLLIYVANVDEVFEMALQQGSREVRPLVDQFYGDRSGTIEDPYGHIWSIATHLEDISPAEMEARFREMFEG